MAKLLMRGEGFDGTVELMEDRVVIHRTGFFNMFKYGLNAKREIPISAISEVMFKPPILLGMGSIEFVRSGRSSDDNKGNSNVVKFKKSHLKSFEKIKEKIFEISSQYARQK